MSEIEPQLGALVVDDDISLAEEVAHGLRAAGQRTLVAHSAQEARAILANDTSIGVVVADVGIPDGDGFSLSRYILDETPPEHARAIVIMTGQSGSGHAQSAVRAGASDYLRKPFDLDEMIDAVSRAMGSARQQRLDHMATRDTVERLAHAQAVTEGVRRIDPVTGLPNDLALESALRAGTDGRTALLMIRLGGLQFVTAAGSRALHDALLAAAARRFRLAAASHEMFALREPAHFALLARAITPAEAMALGRALTEALATPLMASGHAVALTASVGLAQGGEAEHGTPLEACAQVAMAEASRLGGGRMVVFSAPLHGEALRRFRISQYLPGAAAEGQLSLHYQPMRTPDLRCLRGHEALMRWTHPILGCVRPGEFIAAAEETGAILDIGAWAARTAVRQVALWRKRDAASPYASVNVSGRQLMESDVAGLFAELLAEYRLPPDAVLIEVTESVAVGDAALTALQALREIGLRVAIDDFGAGFSSLGALRRLPADVVKFDRSLLPTGAGEGVESQFYINLLGAIRGLGFGVVSEGIETEGQRRLAAEAGADLVQGFHIGRPMPAEAVPGRVLEARGQAALEAHG